MPIRRIRINGTNVDVYDARIAAIDGALVADSTNPVENGAVVEEFGKVSYIGDTLETVSAIPDEEPDVPIPTPTPSGSGEENVIEVVKVNGTALTVDANKAVDIPVPTKVSDLTNDSGFITTYTETDPTVPAWAKAATKPTYTASEVGALPASTAIPSKTSDLTNDSGFLTGYTETDPVFAASAAHGITSSDISNWNGKTSNVGTITGITMNGASKGTSGVVDLGTVITSLSGYVQDGQMEAYVDTALADYLTASAAASTYQAKLTQASYLNIRTLELEDQAEALAVPSWETVASSDDNETLGDALADPARLTTDATHRWLTDTQISTWNAKQSAITISSSEPTSSQGSNGDIWIVI